MAHVVRGTRLRVLCTPAWCAAGAQVDDGDVILTYAYSHIVSQVLLEAFKPSDASRPAKRFRVVVVDARPEQEGLKMLRVRRPCAHFCSRSLSCTSQGISARGSLVA